jgi:uncharacterized protein
MGALTSVLSLHGHLWTLGPRLRDNLRPPPMPVAQPWSTLVEDERVGSVRLSGSYQASQGPDLAVLVHGMGGCATSPYMLRAAAACAERGLACLRLNLRGADRCGEDFYHAGLTSDLHAALASPEFGRYARIVVLGTSLGGHLALRLACEARDPRVSAVAAVSSPLDLAASAAAIDGPVFGFYRRYLLGSLKEIYESVAARRPVPTPVTEVRRIRHLRVWDRKTVAPRHGFANAADYYRRESVGPRLARLGLPALLVAAERDPMVPASTVRPALASASRLLEVRWMRRGGHVGFPADFDLGLPGALGLAPQVLTWLLEQ